MLDHHRPTLLHIGRRLHDARSLLLLNPEKGDGDSLGSTLALANHCASIGKPYTVYAHRQADSTFSFLPRFEEIVSDPAQLDLDAFDLIIGADFSDLPMTGIADKLERRDPNRTTFILIDHHPTNPGLADINLIEPQSTATTEILFALFDHHGWPIDKDIATCLLTGILTDSDRFANRNTTFLSFSIAAQLLRRGARMHAITRYAFRNKSVGMLRLWGKALSRLQHNSATGLVTTFITLQDMKEAGVDEEAAGGIANFLNGLAGAKAVLVLRESAGGRVKGSFRTTGDDVNVAEMAKQFGGGGHRRAAGFVLQGKLQEVDGVWQII